MDPIEPPPSCPLVLVAVIEAFNRRCVQHANMRSAQLVILRATVTSRRMALEKSEWGARYAALHTALIDAKRIHHAREIGDGPMVRAPGWCRNYSKAGLRAALAEAHAWDLETARTFEDTQEAERLIAEHEDASEERKAVRALEDEEYALGRDVRRDKECVSAGRRAIIELIAVWETAM